MSISSVDIKCRVKYRVNTDRSLILYSEITSKHLRGERHSVQAYLYNIYNFIRLFFRAGALDDGEVYFTPRRLIPTTTPPTQIDRQVFTQIVMQIFLQIFTQVFIQILTPIYTYTHICSQIYIDRHTSTYTSASLPKFTHKFVQIYTSLHSHKPTQRKCQ